MADIRKEIQDFQDAVYGEEVRGEHDLPCRKSK